MGPKTGSRTNFEKVSRPKLRLKEIWSKNSATFHFGFAGTGVK